MKLTANQLIEKAFWLLMAGVVSFFVNGVRDELKAMNGSINELNTKMAVVVTTLSGQGSMVEDHEVRIRKLETKRRDL